jgi:predicted transcriptional regulator
MDHKNSCVSEIAKDVKSNVATVSFHLQVLIKEGILSRVREGKKIFYEMNKNSFTSDLKRLICKCK